MTVKTIGQGGGFAVTADFSSLNTWATYVAGLALSEDEIGRVLFKSAANELSAAAVTFTTPSSANGFRVILEAGDTSGSALGSFRNHISASANLLSYNPANGAAISFSSGAAAMTINCARFTLRNLQIKNRAIDATTLNLANAASSRSVDSCIIYYQFTGNSNILIATNDSADITNCLIVSNSGGAAMTGIDIQGAGAFYNNTIACLHSNATGKGINRNTAAAFTFRNNAIYGWNTDWNNGTGAAVETHCGTDKSAVATGLPGTSNQTSLVGATEWRSVTNGSEDFRLATASTKLKENGFTASTVTTVDIIGQTRS